MALIIQKYGGTSVGNVEKIKNVAHRVRSARQDGNDVIVVVSAMGEETDRLLDLARDITDQPDEMLPMGRLAKLDFLKIMNRLQKEDDGKYIEVTDSEDRFEEVIKRA
ncbi:MAG: aspartate kinase [bacterium]|nr:MAG: aspartate kinase [bacterium]